MPQRLALHLIARGLVPAARVDEALKRVQAQGGTLDTALLETGAISESGLLQALADVSGLKLVNLADFEPNAEAGSLMPMKISQQLNVVPLSVDGASLHIASVFPVPHAQLKDVGFLLGRKLTLWVALECRIRDWQAAIYQLKLEPRLQRLLSQLDPSRPPVAAEAAQASDAELLAPEVLERVAQGIIEEPILLDKKRAASSIQVADRTDATRIMDVSTHGSFSARGPAASTSATAPELSAVRGPPTSRSGVRFPGGVLPPRQAPKPKAPPPESPTAWLTPALGPRAVIPEERRPGPPVAPEGDATLRLQQPSLEETDFSALDFDVEEAPAPPPGAPRLFSPPPVRRQEAAAPPTPPAPPPSRPPEVDPLRASFLAPPSRAAPAPADEEPEWLTEFEEEEPSREPPPRDERTAPPASTLRERLAAAVALPPPVELATPAAPSPAAAPPPTATPPDDGALQPAPPGLGQSVAAEWTLAQARTSLKQVTHDRDALIGVALEYGLRAFDFVAAFAVVRGFAVGWDGRGEADAPLVRSVAIPLDAGSVFRTVAVTRGSYVGPLPPDALSQHFLGQLGRSPRTVFLWPVEVQSKLVALVYGDCGWKPVSQRRLADFILFCQDLPSAFHELIVFRKQQAVPQPEYLAAPTPAPEMALGTLDSPEGPADPEWYHSLLQLLTGPDATERNMALMELMKTPVASARALARAFPGPSGWSRLPVLQLPEADELGPLPGALGRLGPAGAQALAPLLDAGDSDTRYLALLTAGSLRYPDVVPGVMRALFDFEPDISSAARAAATALKGLQQFQSRLPSVRQELAAADPLRRSLAARALGVLHDRESIEGLINLTGSEDGLTAQAAAEALEETTRVRLGTNTRAWLAWWAGARDRRRVEWLVEALDADELETRLAVIEELSRALGSHHGYLADAPLEERITALSRWRALVEERPDLEVA